MCLLVYTYVDNVLTLRPFLSNNYYFLWSENTSPTYSGLPIVFHGRLCLCNITPFSYLSGSITIVDLTVLFCVTYVFITFFSTYETYTDEVYYRLNTTSRVNRHRKRHQN